MSVTTVNLGYVPKNRGEYSSTASYYKDNIVQYNGSSYICNPPTYDPDTAPTAYITGVAPYTSDPATPNTGWAVFSNDSSGVGEGVYNVSVDHTTDSQPKVYASLSAAITDVPAAKKKGGMEIKFILNNSNYVVDKEEGLTTQPTGTLITSSPTIVDGTYKEAQLTSYFSTLPTSTGAGNAVVYYKEVSGDTTTYTSWTITLQSYDNKYVQARFMLSTFTAAQFGNVANWQGVDDEPTPNSNNLVKSGWVAKNIYYATGYSNAGYGLQIERGENSLVTVTLFKKSAQFIWHTGGCTRIDKTMSTDIVLTFTHRNSAIYTIYYNPKDKTLNYAEASVGNNTGVEITNIPSGVIVLEQFWTYGEAGGLIDFSVEQNNHIGFASGIFERLNSMKATPSQLKKIAELDTRVAELASLKNIHYATGYSNSGYGLTVELGENNAVTVTIYKKTSQFIWHSGGTVRIDRIMSENVVLTFTRVNNVIYTIYYNPANTTFDYAETTTSKVSGDVLVNIPDGSIILEEFWTYGNDGLINFSIDQNEHIGFNSNVFNQLSSMKATFGQLKKIAELEEEIVELKKSKAPFPYSGKIFLQVGCIGDSYTEGYQYSEGSPTYPNYDYAWPHYISKITGNNWINFAKSGSSSKSWVTEEDPQLTNMDAVRAKKCQAYIIGLGINDSSSTMPTRVALGTIEDIGTDADSYYAYYYKLIQNLLLINPKAIIFCNTGAAVKATYNQAIRDIVAYCKYNNQQVWLCDLAHDYNTTEYYLNPVFVADHVNGHYTAIGYEFMAECYIRVISDVINANQTQFREVETIPFDE